MDIQAFEKGKNHLTSVDHMISNLKKKWKTITRVIWTNINTWNK